MKVLAVTGYKPFEIGIFKHDDPALFYIKKAIESRILALLDEGLEWILISGQLGAEIWAAEVAFSLQEEYPELKVAVITPFFDQEKNWNEKNKELYEAVLAQSDYTESLTHRPYESPAQFKQKNRFFIEKADGLLILYDEEVAGSPVYMLNEAKKAQEKRGFPIYMITMDDLRSTVEDYTFYEE
ncbi:DUF1273 domain-containing protein [Bacillus glycinifermentans]|uniref:UPF0398 protein AB447_210025 n=1 Tax=Bacillus glycinifermentans TaxID=1664069 RepID=A0A0T6BTC5_9BACI|nr:DUF1273 domain-containing protein [Bacillus glycinifermentans]ATH92123.1 DUF1273 domain-containing protein [Bacillus glycinifermentans]KRT94871.1 hypothetical protein AB447_210025 [Bacillus glycinifermentans]MEC0484627.1 DUF1273 domain-containing protein [Bacillus glycinifermentans]MEC0494712.1 DUF1273 domain-containing protein [Bacillus glycinifermentans]MEC0541144.1 DUF1273 domain-containing protein [Bacillus glycinifermentans]